MTYVSYEYNKERIYAWREKNPDAHRALSCHHARIYRFKNKIKKQWVLVLEELKHKFN